MRTETISLAGTQAFGLPPGRCIYCGSTDNAKGLSDEHIIAFCLASDFYLPGASCESCAKKTSYLEGYAGRHICGPMRIHFGIQSRRKRINLGSVPVIFQTEHGDEIRQIPRENLPVSVLLPVWDPPGVFREGVCTPVHECEIWRWQEDGVHEKTTALKKQGDVDFRIVSQFRPLVFARLLAKIAHAMAVALLGVNSFVHYLPRIILGEDDDAALLVGGAEPPTEPLPRTPNSSRKTHHHDIMVTIMSAPGKPDIVVAKIRLFLHIGTPTYWVIVGEALSAAKERLKDKNADRARGPTIDKLAH
jgi:hypothetical protein